MSSATQIMELLHGAATIKKKEKRSMVYGASKFFIEYEGKRKRDTDDF